ncbi:unnamed protein product [Alopecurus aequalis]
MRIRRRPQAQALTPSPSPHPQQPGSDPSTAPAHHWLPRYEEEVHLRYYSNADLGDDEPSPLPWSHPQGDNVVGRSGGGGAQAQRQGAADGHASLENGHRDERGWPGIDAAGERLVNGNGVVTPAMPLASTAPQLNVKEGIKSDGGPKRRRGPAVLLEGSRCSRVNGRGWRCSQPTLVGYSLCDHHLGKGRQSRSGRSAAGVPKIGRTEPASSRKNAVVAAPPDATEPAEHLING